MKTGSFYQKTAAVELWLRSTRTKVGDLVSAMMMVSATSQDRHRAAPERGQPLRRIAAFGLGSGEAFPELVRSKEGT